MKKVVKYIQATLVIFILNNGCYAGIVTPTAHSRANCAGFNESVTWHLGHSYWWRVESHHYVRDSDPKPLHTINTGKNVTWRAAAYHMNEAYAGRGDRWKVCGYHFYWPNGPDGREVMDVWECVLDCSIYDGWWDH